MTIFIGDALTWLKKLPTESVNCIVTSPPYFQVRDYQVTGQYGLEETPQAYVDNMVAVFREARRVLRDDGTCWINLGDTYSAGGRGHDTPKQQSNKGTGIGEVMGRFLTPGFASKQLLMIPHRVAIALQADGWWVRNDIVWAKGNPMPESVKDRCTKSHEYIFLCAKSERYYFDADAIREPAVRPGDVQIFGGQKALNDTIAEHDPRYRNGSEQWGRVHTQGDSRNRRDVWTIATTTFSGSHFATMPMILAETCIKAGCPENGIVLDPFGGAGTTALAAIKLNRLYQLIELNPKYVGIAQQRIRNFDPYQEKVYADGSKQLALPFAN